MYIIFSNIIGKHVHSALVQVRGASLEIKINWILNQANARFCGRNVPKYYFINRNDNSSLERDIARDFRFVYKNLVSFGLLIKLFIPFSIFLPGILQAYSQNTFSVQYSSLEVTLRIMNTLRQVCVLAYPDDFKWTVFEN
jgi:hypothetical protein